MENYPMTGRINLTTSTTEKKAMIRKILVPRRTGGYLYLFRLKGTSVLRKNAQCPQHSLV